MAFEQEVLNRHWREIKNLHIGVLNVAISEKWAAGVNTHRPSITVFVANKINPSLLKEEELVPPEIEGVPTDVIELKPVHWVAGRTSISELHPLERKHRLGLREIVLPKAMKLAAPVPPVPNFDVNWQAWCSPVQDQANCGCCLSEDTCGIMEARYRQAIDSITDPILLSVAHLFFCTPGASCENGAMTEDVLNQAMNGVALASDLPYQDKDMPCGQGLPADWYLRGKRIKSWTAITDINLMKTTMLQGPMVSVMTVHSSFFNYVSGVYASQGATDPIEGGHGIGNIGGQDAISAWFRRNSWGPGWGMQGYFWIAYGDSDCDQVMYQVEMDTNPLPVPSPTPSKCSVGNGLAKMLNLYGKAFGRRGRFHYLNPADSSPACSCRIS